MDQKIVGRIVCEMFEKAKKGSASHKKYALSKYISDEMDKGPIPRTIERAYNKYILKRKESNPQSESVDFFCQYLGYENYGDYVEKVINSVDVDPPPPTTKDPPPTNLYIKIVVGIGLSIVFMIFVNSIIKDSNKCMAWVNDHYEKISCDLNLHPKTGRKVEPLDSKMLVNFRKVEVDRGYRFFINQDHKKPLIWYYKNSKGGMEYYTAPGVHPITGETLKKITKNIIEKYVPIHIYRPDSFIGTEKKIKD